MSAQPSSSDSHIAIHPVVLREIDSGEQEIQPRIPEQEPIAIPLQPEKEAPPVIMDITHHSHGLGSTIEVSLTAGGLIAWYSAAGDVAERLAFSVTTGVLVTLIVTGIKCGINKLWERWRRK